MKILILKNKKELRSALIACFNDEEIRTLCFDLAVDYENLAGITKEGKVREFISLLERLERTNDLLAVCTEQRPSIDWQPLFATTTISGERIIQQDEIDQSLPPSTIAPVAIWMILLVLPASWLAGHFIGIWLTNLPITAFVILGTIGGVTCILLSTLLGLWISNSSSRIKSSQVAQISFGFLLAGLLGGFVGLFLWLIGCPFQSTLILQHIGCNDTSKLLWRLGSGFASFLGLIGAIVFMLAEFSAIGIKATWTRYKGRKLSS